MPKKIYLLDGKPYKRPNARTETGASVVPDVSSDLAVTDDLTTEMMAQPSRFASYAAMHDYAEARANKARYDRHCFEEDLEKKIREGKFPVVGKRMNENAIKLTIRTHPKMRWHHRRVMLLEAKAARLKTLREALTHRRDMLESVGYHHNNEMRGTQDVHVLKEKAKHKIKTIHKATTTKKE